MTKPWMTAITPTGGLLLQPAPQPLHPAIQIQPLTQQRAGGGGQYHAQSAPGVQPSEYPVPDRQHPVQAPAPPMKMMHRPHGLDHSLLIAGLESLPSRTRPGCPPTRMARTLTTVPIPAKDDPSPAGADVAPCDWIYYSASTENVKGKEFALNLDDVIQLINNSGLGP